MMTSVGKIRSLPQAITWRASQAGPIVFTNGVFDLLHPGHVDLLEAARSEGQALIVGLNSNASARRLGKGPDRPIFDATARARILAGLAAVDCVVVFEEETPLELIQALTPDVLVKGADYSRDRIVGADWIESQGGRVVRVPFVTGFSTTALLERFRASS